MGIGVIAAALASVLAASAEQTIVTPKMTEFDLENVHRKKATCADRGSSDDIIVCAPKNMNIWIPAADKAKFTPKPLRGEFTGPLDAETTVHVIPSHNPMAVAPAAAVTLKWRF